MPIFDDAKALRKTIETTSKTIARLTVKRSKAATDLEKIERDCRHQWSDMTAVKGKKNTYKKSCTFCGKTIVSDRVEVKF